MPKLLTPLEASKLLGVSRGTLYKIINQDPSFPAVRVGERKWIISEDTLFNWIQNKNIAKIGGINDNDIGNKDTGGKICKNW